MIKLLSLLLVLIISANLFAIPKNHNQVDKEIQEIKAWHTLEDLRSLQYRVKNLDIDDEDKIIDLALFLATANRSISVQILVKKLPVNNANKNKIISFIKSLTEKRNYSAAYLLAKKIETDDIEIDDQDNLIEVISSAVDGKNNWSVVNILTAKLEINDSSKDKITALMKLLKKYEYDIAAHNLSKKLRAYYIDNTLDVDLLVNNKIEGHSIEELLVILKYKLPKIPSGCLDFSHFKRQGGLDWESLEMQAGSSNIFNFLVTNAECRNGEGTVSDIVTESLLARARSNAEFLHDLEKLLLDAIKSVDLAKKSGLLNATRAVTRSFLTITFNPELLDYVTNRYIKMYKTFLMGIKGRKCFGFHHNMRNMKRAVRQLIAHSKSWMHENKLYYQMMAYCFIKTAGGTTPMAIGTNRSFGQYKAVSMALKVRSHEDYITIAKNFPIIYARIKGPNRFKRQWDAFRDQALNETFENFLGE